MSKRVAVLMGGWSSEREVSLNSAREVIKAIEVLGYTPLPIDVTRDLSQLIQALTPRPDVVFNALHGYGGEDGVIQGILEVLEIPYTHSGVLASALGMDKAISREIFMKNGIPVPPWVLVTKAEFCQKPPMELPFVIKPRCDGSSRGVYLVDSQEMYKKICQNWEYGEGAIIEKYFDGREIQVGVLGDKALGTLEVKRKTKFFDYEAKYTPGKADRLVPAPISQEATEKVMDYALKAHQLLNCRGGTRLDFMYEEKDGEPYFYLLELNSQPGITTMSHFPLIAAEAGIPFPQLIEQLIADAQCDQ